MNRLSHETSPYLLQHASNPVDWWPWCAEAFDVARSNDRPVLLSVGYAACHWCHVMAHESFEDPEVAGVMNDNFVNIKVDREERPDVDAVYMEATQAMTGSGGWPMTAFLTPDGRPFYCGTYFPPAPMQGMPSFTQLLDAITRTWRERRSEIEQAGGQMVEMMNRSILTGDRVPDAATLDRAVEALAGDFDSEHAGFGGAPKFPPSMVLEFLLRNAARNGPDSRALAMAGRTLEAMARSGMYDQVGGGFARYSVDRAWIVPHFEKMLYDNALLLRSYVHWHRLTGDAGNGATGNDLAARIAVETADFMVDELRQDGGGFASSLDADTPEGEGSYYVWTPAQLAELFGPERGRDVAELFGVTDEGTFEHGASTLRLLGEPDPEATARLREARARRTPPGVDEKVVTAWNGLAITAFASLGMTLDRPEYVRTAVETGELMASLHTTGDGRLVRSSMRGVAGAAAGVLEDYANLAEAYLALLTATGDAVWLERAGSLLDVVLDQFFDADGAVFDTAADAPALIKRPQDPTESSTPSGRFAAAGALLSYAALTGSARHRTAAEQALALVDRLAERAPRACGWGLAVAEAYAAGPLEVAVVGSPESPGFEELRAHAVRSTSPGAVVVAGSAGSGGSGIPLLADRPLVDGRPTAYVCRGFVCDQPVTEVHRLDERIHPWRGRAGGARG